MARIKCPRITCRSTNIMAVDTKKKFSLGKALVGNTVGFVVGGPAGGIIGGATGINGKNGKTKFVCQDCGKVFEKQL